MRGASAIVGMLMVVGAVAGCGSSSGGSAAVALTKWLPPGADFYSAADLVSLREDLDLPEDADPLPSPEPLGDPNASADFVELARLALADLVELSADPRVIAALDLGTARTIASSSDRSGFALTIVSTSADTGDIGSALGDLGFADHGGILSKGSAGPSFRLDDGLIIVARDPALL
nr:hypothetical protein [Solirubrobacterales bacterium]